MHLTCLWPYILETKLQWIKLTLSSLSKLILFVQTGPKTQSGGLNDGLTNVEYQGSLNLNVVIPPINEAEKVVIRNKNKDTNLFLSI